MELTKLIETLVPKKYSVKNITNMKHHDKAVINARNDQNKIYVIQKNNKNLSIFDFYNEPNKEYLIYHKHKYLAVDKEKKSIDEHKNAIYQFITKDFVCYNCLSDADIQICSNCYNYACKSCIFLKKTFKCADCNTKYEMTLY